MLLAIDIGNTFTKFGVFKNASLLEKITVSTVRTQTADEIFHTNLDYPFRAVIIASVVSELQTAYREFSQKRFNIEPIFVDNSFDFDLKINYFPPESLGVDRLINAFAAAEKLGAPCIVCSFGTATTIDAVNSKREFLGGIIAPGMRLMSESLFQKTSKLPQIEIKKPASVIGNSTQKSIESGIYFGSIGMIDGIIERMLAELKEPAKIIATGGFAHLIAESLAKISVVEENLLLEGLRLIYGRRQKD